jgi:CBS domain-containing protein
MWDEDCGAIPVTGPDGVVKGMITDRHVCMACFTRDQSPSKIVVQDAMSRRLYSCGPGSSVADAEVVIRTNKVRRVPVVDGGGKFVGVVSLADIAREASRPRNRGSKEIDSEEVLQVLGSISQPQASAH